MKRQLHIVNKYFYPVQAGIETCILETYSRFDPDKWDITIHTSADTLNEQHSLALEDERNGLKIKRYKTTRGFFFPKLPWGKEGVIAIYNFSLLPILPLLAIATFYKMVRRKKATLIFAPHGGFTPKWEVFSPVQKAIKFTLHRVFGTHMINYAVDMLHSVAQWEKERLMEEGIHDNLIHVIPNGVEDAGHIQKLSVDPSTKHMVASLGRYLVTIGRIHKIKNLHVAIDALSYMPEDIKLIILGQVEDMDYYLSLQKMIMQKGLSDRVVFGGTVRGENKFYIIRHALAMVHPSLYEVDPLVVKEAISQGTICIGAANTGTKYLIRDGINGFSVPTNNAKAIAHKVTFILSPKNKEKIATMKRMMIREKQVYVWDTIAKKIEFSVVRIMPHRGWYGAVASLGHVRMFLLSQILATIIVLG